MLKVSQNLIHSCSLIVEALSSLFSNNESKYCSWILILWICSNCFLLFLRCEASVWGFNLGVFPQSCNAQVSGRGQLSGRLQYLLWSFGGRWGSSITVARGKSDMSDMWKGEEPFLKSDWDWDPDSIQQLRDVTSFSLPSCSRLFVSITCVSG